MRNSRFGAALALLFGFALFGQSAQAAHTLSAFQSDADMAAFFKKFRSPRHMRAMAGVPDIAMPAPPPIAVNAMAGAPSGVQQVVVTAEKSSSPGITNNQEAGVDEGDIVKQRGDILVILRRGRLFTVSLAHGHMRPVDFIDAYPPGVDARDDWYDEMLLKDDRIVVIGYSYQRGGTEINRFHVDSEGHLRFEDAYQLRSNDYYSSRNYASRLIGSRLIFYTPLYLDLYGDNPFESLPALRHWTGDTKGRFARIASARQVYLPGGLTDPVSAGIDTLHSVTNCDVTAPVLECRATVVLGPDSRSFYVSAHAVYVWVAQSSWSSGRDHRAPPSLLYRMPLDGSAPSAIAVRGAPVDQFSFREDGDVLNVLVRADSAGDAMWNGEHSDGATALLRIPLNAFGDGAQEAGIGQYRSLPTPRDGDFHNRFVGNYVLYGAGNDWGAPASQRGVLVAASLRGDSVTQIPLPAGIDRIEVMGPDGLVVGSGAHNVTFSTIDLSSGRAPRLGDSYTEQDAAQAETRSHAFFYKPESDDGQSGVIGLPVARAGRPEYRQLFENSAAMIYLRRADHRFVPLGELDAHSEGAVDDACVASCVDWYGNARPIFLPGRTFALLGYELVEGALSGTAVNEVDRVNFAPRPADRPPVRP